MHKKYVIMIRPYSNGAPWASVPGTYDYRHEAEDAKKEIHQQDTNTQVLIVPVFL